MNSIQTAIAVFLLLALRGFGDIVPKLSCGIKAGDHLTASALIQQLSVTPKLMATPEQSALIPFVSVGYGVTFADTYTGLPVVVDQCTIVDARYGYYRLYQGVKSEVFNNLPLSSFRFESSAQSSGALFMTASPTSTVPVSPPTGEFRGKPVTQVGAVFFTKMQYRQTQAPPYFRPTKPEESNVYQFSITLQYKHQGFNYLKTITIDDLTMSYTVTEALPQITLVQPPTPQASECVEASGEFLSLFKLQWTCNLAQGWQDVPVSPTATANGCRWDIGALPPAPCRFYRLIQDPKWYPWNGGG